MPPSSLGATPSSPAWWSLRARRDAALVGVGTLLYLALAASDAVGTMVPALAALERNSLYADELLVGVIVFAAMGLFWAFRRAAEMRALAGQLVHSQHLAEAGFEHSPHPTFIIDRTTLRFLAVNDAAVRQYGWTREEMLRDLISSDLLPPEDRDSSRHRLLNLRDGVIQTALGDHVRKDGTRFAAERTFVGIAFSGTAAVVSIVNDISARVEAAQRQHEAELRYRAVFDTQAAGILEVHPPTGEILACNDAFARIVGRAPDSIVGMSVLALTHPDDLPSTERMHEVLESRQATAHSLFKRYVRPDGSVRWAVTAVANVSSDGSTTRNIAVIVDITDQRLAEADREQLADRLALTLDVIGEGIFDWDLVSDEWMASPALNRMLGFAPDELPNMISSWRLRVHPEDLSRFESELAAHLAGATVNFELEHRLRHRDSRFVWVMARGQVVKRDAQGRAQRMVGSLTDVTERRELEAQLHQSQKMEAVGQLAGGIAHDFNNLLTVIRTGLELVLAENLSEETRADLSEVEIATDRAANLTQQLLAFGRRRLAQARLVSLNDSVDELAKLLTRVLTEDIDVRRRLQSRGYVMADPGHIGQALLNIAVNARDAMPEGGVLTLSTYDQTIEAGAPETHDGVKPGRYCVICVGDSGHGMSEEVRTRIFEPFFTTKPLGKGTGLGLASVYGVVKQADGYVRVESAPNAGSRFFLYFPTAAAAPPAARALQESDVPGGSETILVVEDDAPVRTVAARVLASHGYRVFQAADGAAALATLATEPRVDLVLTDVVMPNMAGSALTIEGRARYPDTAFLVMSAHAPETLSQYAVPADVDLLTKPFTSTSLLQAVRKAMDARRATTI